MAENPDVSGDAASAGTAAVPARNRSRRLRAAGEETRMIEELERGDLYVLYRPKVNVDVVRGIEDVERVYLVLHPYDSDNYRLIALGQNRLPAKTGERHSGYVDRVVSNAAELVREFRDEESRDELSKELRGNHRVPPARPAGEGVYLLFRDDDVAHLGYALELPVNPGPVQEALGLRDQFVITIAVKNPARPPSSQPGLEGRDVDFPEDLLELFEDRPFIATDPPALLDYEAAELLLIGSDARLTEDMGVELDPEREAPDTAEIFLDLHLSRRIHPVEPLFTGQWR